MISCAAIKIVKSNSIHSLIICGHRHRDCYDIINCLDEYWRECSSTCEGFIDHNGNFLNRVEALNHARECGQLSETHRYYQEDHNIDELYSEDLY